MVSALQEQKDIIIRTIKGITGRDWKVLVIDEGSKKILDNVVKEDELLNQNITNIERIEERRDMNADTDAIYFLSPEPHIVDCLMADLERKRYQKTFLVWTALLDPQMRRRISVSQNAQSRIAGFETLSIDFFPRESHLITFRDPWSFPILYHPQCNNLVAQHMQTLAQKITGVCVSLGEYPKVRYYKPRLASHEASVLCSHLARFVQEELDAYAQYHEDFPPVTPRPQGVLFITDRSMDLEAPLIHEFTYQAMAHDLLPIKETDKVYYHTVVNEGQPDEEEKDVEIGEKDEIWVKNRHTHMKDTIEKLMGDFNKFMADNPHFTNKEGDQTSLSAIKDMLVGLPQFQELKEAYSLHLSMAQECMNIFQAHKLPDISTIEQSLATGLDEDFKKPKNMAEQVVRMLDDESIGSADRLRLILMYLLYRDGVIPEDVQRLLAHANLPGQQFETVSNLELLGGRCLKVLKDTRPPVQPLFPRKTAPTAEDEEYSLSRFEPALQLALEAGAKGTLDQSIFPYTKPSTENGAGEMIAQASLRSAKPTWAQGRAAKNDPNQQRVIVFIAGGATYSESRACYEVGRSTNKDIFLATTHMLTPSLFVRQVGDLSQDRRTLDLPIERPKPKAPAHLFEREEKKVPAPGFRQGLPGGPGAAPMAAGKNPVNGQLPPTAQMNAMSIQQAQLAPAASFAQPPPTLSHSDGKKDKKDKKLEKKSKHDGEDGEKKKKKHGFLGIGRK